MSNIFLGEPSQYIKNWFIKTFPLWPAYTTLMFVDGTTETKEISGIATRQNIFDEQIDDCGCDEKNQTLVYCQLGKNVIEININAFSHCASLTSINIPNSVTSIGNMAFSDCHSLPSINIPNSVSSIRNYVFYGCNSLTSVNIPSSISSIGGYAFYNCKSLPSINIPNSVSSIGNGAFCGCISLPSITIPSSVISIGNDPFQGIANANCGDYRSLTSVIFAGRTIEQVQAMAGYPWAIDDVSIISAELS